MDFSPVEIRTEFKDLKQIYQTQHLSIEVVMINQSPHDGKPVLYQLNKDRLTPYDNMNFLRQEFISLPHPAFTAIGDIIEINMTKKLITLVDGNLVTYKYMILVAGIDQKDEAGTVLHTLKEALMMDALNVKEIILKPRHFSSFNLRRNKQKKSVHSFRVNNLSHKNLEKLAYDKISDSNFPQPFLNITPSQMKLCFLQM